MTGAFRAIQLVPGESDVREPQGGRGLLRLLSAVIKIALMSLIVGAALSLFDITAADVLAKAGLTTENVMDFVQRGAVWAGPNIVLGSMVILPVWLVLYLLRPPNR